MSIQCKDCDLEFETEDTLKSHIKMIHVKKPKKYSTPKLQAGEINKKGERMGNDGKIIVFDDGKTKTFKNYVKRMRQSYPDIKVGDKLSPKEARKLFKHSRTTQKSIRGAKLEVLEVKERENGMTIYQLGNKKLKIMWAEGLPFKYNKKSKLKKFHYITRPKIIIRK